MSSTELPGSSRAAITEQKSSEITADFERIRKENEPVVAVVAPVPLDPLAVEELRLAALPKMQLDANNVPLRGLVRWLAEQCGMKYMGLPPGEASERPVTFSSYDNPYEVLKNIAEANNLGFSFNRNMWNFFIRNNNELVARVYQLKDNTMETFDTQTGGDNSGGGGGNTGGGSRTPSPTSSIGGGGGSSGGSSGAGTGSSSGSKTTIKANAKDLEDAVRSYLEMDTTASYATFLQDGSVGKFFAIPKPDAKSGGEITGSANASRPKSSARWISDNNQLYVIATRQQHEYVEGFLEAVDKPQRLVEIDAKIVQTSRDNSRSLGIDWSGVTSPTIGIEGLGSDVNFSDLASTPFPGSAIISSSDLTIGLKALASDSRSQLVGYPRMVGLNNRQVSLKSVIRRPVLNATTTNSQTGSTASTGQVDEQEVGTIIDVFPKILADDNVLMNVVISVSNITGTVVINGNPYPVTSNKLFNYQVIVKSGFTLAVGGLEETVDNSSTTRVPGLGSIPFFGLLFSQSAPQRNNQTVMLFITPRILNGFAGGLTDRPANVTRADPRPPRQAFAGAENESIADVSRSLTNFGQEIDHLSALAIEGRANDSDATKLELLVNELALMDLKLRESAGAMRAKDLESLRRDIGIHRGRLNDLRGPLRNSVRFAS